MTDFTSTPMLSNSALTSLPAHTHYQVGGSLPINATNYVKRQADESLYQGLKDGEFCYVLNSRQMGKSSLQVRTIQRLQEVGIICAAIDMSEIGHRGVTPEQWYAGILRLLENNFNLSEFVNVRTWWRERDFLAPVQRLAEFIEQVLLTHISEKIVIFIDEIDSILALEFPVDDFLGLIRACYNKRAINPNFNRLTFALLGVATPQDLTQSHLNGSTPFNIGKAIALSGFTPTEAQPLLPGLAEFFPAPAPILQEILFWTGGQPFLTQKVCKLVVNQAEALLTTTGDWSDKIHQIIQSHILENWEAQDTPEHLKTIRDRILKSDQRLVRRLGLYQQILTADQLCDDSPEELELRLSGLVVKRGNRLQVANPIYGAVFNQAWVETELDKLPPYSSQLKAWLHSNYQDATCLLTGQELQQALAWTTGKSLRDQDFKFLTASQQQELTQQQQELWQQTQLLEQTKLETKTAQAQVVSSRNAVDQAQLKAKVAQRKARNWITIGSGVLTASLIGAVGFSSLSYQQFEIAQKSLEIEQAATDAFLLGMNAQENYNQTVLLEALPQAIAAGQKLQQLVKPENSLETYPATRPLLALQVILEQFPNSVNRHQFSLHKGAITDIEFSPQGQYLASVGIDDQIKILDLENQFIDQWQGNQKTINYVIWSANGEQLITAGKNGTLKFWHETGQPIGEIEVSAGSITHLSLNPKDQQIAIAGLDIPIQLWQWQKQPFTFKQTSQLSTNQILVRQINFSPQGNYLVTLDGASTIELWNLQTASKQTLPISAISFAFHSSQLLTSTSAGNIALWELESGQLVRQFQTLQLDIKLVKWSPDRQRIATVGIDRSIHLWDLNGRQLAHYQFSENVVNIEFSPDGDLLAVAGSNGTLWLQKIQDLPTLIQQGCQVLQSHPQYVTRSLKLCPVKQ